MPGRQRGADRDRRPPRSTHVSLLIDKKAISGFTKEYNDDLGSAACHDVTCCLAPVLVVVFITILIIAAVVVIVVVVVLKKKKK